MLVIGGGIAGLVAALELARRRAPAAACWRPASSCGGVVSAHRVGGLTLDAGAESFATARPAVTELLAELGLADRIAEPNPVGAWVRHRAGAAPLPAAGLLGIPGRPMGRRRPPGDRAARRAALLARRRAADPGRLARDGPRLGGVVRSRMGRRVLDRLVEPVAGGVYAADPDALEVAAPSRPGLPQALLRRRVAGRGGPAAARRRRAVRVGGGHPVRRPAHAGAARWSGPSRPPAAQIRTGAPVAGWSVTERGWRVDWPTDRR